MLMYGEGHKQGGSQSCCCSVSSLVDALPCGGRPDVLQQHAGQLAPVLDTSHNLHTTRQPSYSLVFMLRSMPSDEDEDLLLFAPCIASLALPLSAHHVPRYKSNVAEVMFGKLQKMDV